MPIKALGTAIYNLFYHNSADLRPVEEDSFVLVSESNKQETCLSFDNREKLINFFSTGDRDKPAVIKKDKLKFDEITIDVPRAFIKDCERSGLPGQKLFINGVEVMNGHNDKEQQTMAVIEQIYSLVKSEDFEHVAAIASQTSGANLMLETQPVYIEWIAKYYKQETKQDFDQNKHSITFDQEQSRSKTFINIENNKNEVIYYYRPAVQVISDGKKLKNPFFFEMQLTVDLIHNTMHFSVSKETKLEEKI